MPDLSRVSERASSSLTFTSFLRSAYAPQCDRDGPNCAHELTKACNNLRHSCVRLAALIAFWRSREKGAYYVHGALTTKSRKREGGCLLETLRHTICRTPLPGFPSWLLGAFFGVDNMLWTILKV